MSKLVRYLSFFLAITMMLAQVSVFGLEGNKTAKEELRGVWIATVFNKDFPSKTGLGEAQQKKELDTIVAQADYMGLNAIFFQVRPNGDALYPSKIFPWSQVLTGTQGKENANGFDPLAYIIKKSHERNIELHAWVNPLRITSGASDGVDTLSLNHPARLNPTYAVKASDNKLYFDPGYPEVRKMITDGIAEIVSNYKVDGIHFDDYFYPNNANTTFDDEASFEINKGNFTDKNDWRRNNINLLVQESSSAIKNLDRNVSFGISPAGVWANSNQIKTGSNTVGATSTYFQHFADTKKWVEEEYLDYIAPQIYWNIGYAPADYEILVKWWSDLCKNSKVALYVGHSAYKINDGAQSEKWLDPQEILNQLKLNKEYGGVGGDIFYGYSTLTANTLEIKENLRKTYVDGETTIDPPPSVKPDDTLDEDGKIDKNSILPKEDVKKNSGEYVSFSCYAPAGAGKVWVELGPYKIALKKDSADSEKTGTAKAAYTGSFVLPPIAVAKSQLNLGKPAFVMEYEGKYDVARSSYSVSVLTTGKSIRIATVSEADAITRIGPATTYNRGTPLAIGATDVIVGESGNFYKLRSGIYIPSSSVTVSNVKEESMADNYISNVEVTDRGNFVDMHFSMPINAPYSLNVSGDVATLSIFNTKGREVPKISANSVFKSVSYKAVSNQLTTYTFMLNGNNKYYGFQAIYENGKLVFSLKCPPKLGSEAKPLENTVIYLDAGHGGSDPGATSVIAKGKNEAHITLEISNQVKAKLTALGAKVVTTRETDKFVLLADRATMMSAAVPDLSISIHVNSVARVNNYQAPNGLEVLYTLEQSKELAQSFQSTLISRLKRTDRKAKEQALAVCRIKECPAILIETGFITNPNDYAWLISATGQAALADAIAEATVTWVRAQN